MVGRLSQLDWRDIPAFQMPLRSTAWLIPDKLVSHSRFPSKVGALSVRVSTFK